MGLAVCESNLTRFVDQLKESMEKERIVGPGPAETVIELTLNEDPRYLKTEMGARVFVLFYIQVICHSPAPDKHFICREEC